MDLFSPPGFLADFARRPALRASFERGWHAIMDNWFQLSVEVEGSSFYNWMKYPPGDSQPQAVVWDAFPRFLERWFEEEDDADRKRLEAAETLRPQTFDGQPLRRIVKGKLADPVPTFYRQQDEYCEWFAHRDRKGRIERVTFTSEGPEYWQFLAQGTKPFFAEDDERRDICAGDMTLVHDLYKEHVSPTVKLGDLLWPHDVAIFVADDQGGAWYRYAAKGDYNVFNKWTTTHGSMHLTHPANSLGAEVYLAARAAILRKDGEGKPVEGTEALVCCSGFGDPNRSSDPAIGRGVNGLAKLGLSVSLDDPVGLYLHGINLDGFRGPNGEDMGRAWTVVRGDADRGVALRAVFDVPADLGLSVDQVLARGKPITCGGQIADEVQISLTGLVKKLGDESDERYPCVAKCCKHPVKAVRTVIDVAGDCAAVDWDEVAPYLATGPAPAEPDEALGEAARPVPAADAPIGPARPYDLLAAKR